MELHTFIVNSAVEAVPRIRAELGPDAVVVSVRRIAPAGITRFWKGPQVEVVAGVQQAGEEQPVDPIAELQKEIRELRLQVSGGQGSALGSAGSRFDVLLDGLVEPTVSPVLSKPSFGSSSPGTSDWRIGKFLLQTGVLPVYVERLLADLDATHGPAPSSFAREMTLAQHWLKKQWSEKAGHCREQSHVFVGPAGSGKSTVLAKWLAMATLGTRVPAAVYQLDTEISNSGLLPSIYAEILGARFERSLPFEWEGGELSFIDLPGIHPADQRGWRKASEVIAALPSPGVHLVLNGAYESSTLVEQARSYTSLGVTDIILTHLDEESKWGKIWNLVLGTNFKVRFLSSGQNIPGEFLEAAAEVVLSRQFGRK